MIIRDRGLNGSITKGAKAYNIDINYSGWGSMELYQILDKLNLLNKIENMKQGDSIIFRDRFVIR